MSEAVKIVSELFLLVLSVIAAPSDLKEFRVDQIQTGGRVETIIVRRDDVGFTLLEQQADRQVERGSIRPVAGKPSAFTLKLENGPEQTFDFAAGIQGFTVDALQKAQTLDLKAGDGVTIHVHRSGKAVYLTPSRGRITYSCH
jgi:ATP-dependent Clp protease adapter protein ClpS